MPLMNKAAVAILAAAVLGTGIPHVRAADADIDAKANEVAKSLVVVEYTLRNENFSRQETGQGLVIEKDGIILIAGGLIPEAFPKEWVKDLKIRLPLKDFTSVPAKFLGRTQDRLFAFLKVEPEKPGAEKADADGKKKTAEPFDAPAFEPGDTAPAKLGEDVFSVGLLGKAGGYATYVGVSRVKTIMDLTHKVIGTASFGLTTGTSPVFDVHSGNLVGITLPAMGDSMVLRIGKEAQRIELTDDEQSSAFLPQSEFADVFKNIPTKAFDLPRPWMAVDEISGIPEDVKALRNIQQPAAVVIGSVIPDEPADKAGLQAQDIILTVDGKQFSKSPVPELMVMHFSRLVEKHKPGDVLTLGILRDGKKMDLKLTLGTTPKQSSEMPHIFSPRIGIVTRDLVFADAYSRHLPQDTKGVMVVLVKNGAPATLGPTPLRAGNLITKVDDQPVENQHQFEQLMKKLDDNKEAKEAVFVVIQSNGETGVCRIDLTK